MSKREKRPTKVDRMEKIELKREMGYLTVCFCLRSGADMNNIFNLLIMMALFTNTAHSGLVAYGICQTGCNAVWVACVTAAGGVAGVSTGGVGVPAAILACNVAQGVCMAACVAAGLSPTP